MSDEKETSEINAITEKYNSVIISGKKVFLNYPMKAWRVINTDFGGLDGIQKSLTDDPIGFMTERLATLLQIGLVEKNIVTLDEINKEIDEKNMTEIKDDILSVIMLAITGTLPETKVGKKGNPQTAEK